MSGSPSYSGRDSYRSSPQADRPLHHKYLTSDSSPALKTRLTVNPSRNTRSSDSPRTCIQYNNNHVLENTRIFQDLFRLRPTRISLSGNTEQALLRTPRIKVCMIQVRELHTQTLSGRSTILAKYTPNPDWLLYRPWGYKFRKARFVNTI